MARRFLKKRNLDRFHWKRSQTFFFVCCFVYASTLHARAFNMKNESVGSYLLLSAGTSVVKTQAFANESVATSYDGEVNNNYSGEFGVFFGGGPILMSLGMEIIQPPPLKGVIAKQSGSQVYLMDSSIMSYAPKASLDLNLKTGGSYRVFVRGGAGYAFVQVKNDYSSVALSAGTHSVSMKGTSISYGGSLGLELFMMDTTTFILQADYRVLRFKELKYSQDVTTFTGTYSSGDSVTDTTGAKRELDLSSTMMTMGFRFYF